MKTDSLSDILITGAHDFMAPYLFREFQESFPDASVWMLGRGDLAGMKVDLAVETPVMPAAMECVVHVDGTDSGSFNASTAIDEVRSLARSLETAPPRSLVYISSAIVYGLEQGEGIDETTTLSPSLRDALAKRDVEDFLTNWCESHGVILSVLRPAMVIGTGMGGEMRALVNSIYRGTYRHVNGNEARVSVIHAIDVARAARMAAGKHGVWIITDGTDPLRRDLVEALAWRLRHKRV
ncbi:MAG: NAD-dependent epimerase/dehydratase family protein, partial [Muribaculaceae bacterium]|nr:NAD-dependent epimerase/dehydratase family protein [Muribaculaceae bacterium]